MSLFTPKQLAKFWSIHIGSDGKLFAGSAVRAALSAHFDSKDKFWLAIRGAYCKTDTDMLYVTLISCNSCDEFLETMSYNCMPSIKKVNWTLTQTSERALEIETSEDKVRLIEVTDELDALIGRRNPLTNTVVSLKTAPRTSLNWVFNAAMKALQEAGYEEVSQEMLRLRKRPGREITKTGDSIYDWYFYQLDVITKYITLTLDELQATSQQGDLKCLQ